MEQNKTIWYPELQVVDSVYRELSWKYGDKVTHKAMTERLKIWCKPDKVLATDWINRHLDKEQRGPNYPLIKI